MKYSGLLWNSATEYAPEILSKISSNYQLLKTQIYNLSDCYENFVKDIYSEDSIAEWKVEKKINYMRQFMNRKVTVFDIDIDNPTFRYVDVKKRSTCVQIEEIKKSIRSEYSKKIQPYFFDTIIHMSDDQKENYQMQRVLQKYKHYLEDEKIYKQDINYAERNSALLSIIADLQKGRN